MAERRSAATVARPKAPRTPRPMSATGRDKLAKQKILTAINAADEKAAAIAALEAVSERLSWDAALQQVVRQKYAEIQALGAGRPTQRTTTDEPMPPLIRTPGLNRQTPLHVLDPYELALDYGRDKLRNVLGRAAQKNLKVATGLVQERNPGTKPVNARTNQGLIDYIVQYVAGPEY